MEKIKEIDYLRGISTIIVLLIHITTSYLTYEKDSLTYILYGSFNCALTFAVPAFLFISALIMTYQLKHKDNINWFKFLSKRILKVLLALILWSLIYVFCWGDIKTISLEDVIGYLTLGSASYHLYFIPLIIQLYLIFPLIWLITKLISKIKINTFISFILALTLGILLHSAFTLTFRLNIFKTFPNFATIIFSYTLPIIIGVWLGFNYEKAKNFFNKKFIFVLTLLTIVACYLYVNLEFVNYQYRETLLFSPIYWTLIILTITYLLRHIKNSNFLSKISSHSFIIYLSHPLILNIVNTKLITKTINLTDFSAINFLVEVIIKLAIVLVFSYLVSLVWYYIKKVVSPRCATP